MSQNKTDQAKDKPTINAQQRLLTKAVQAKAVFDGLKKALNAPSASPPPSNGAAFERTSREDKAFFQLAIAFEVEPSNRHQKR